MRLLGSVQRLLDLVQLPTGILAIMLNMFEAANSRVQHVNAGGTNSQAKSQSPILLRLVDLGDFVVWLLHRDAVLK